MNFSQTASTVFAVLLVVILGCIIHGDCQLILKDGAPVALTGDGPIRGRIFESRGSRTYYSFRGIPYGKQERFQVAEPTPRWTTVRDALEFGPKCPQVSLHDAQIIVESEDCLFLNVFVPVVDREKTQPKGKILLPVMFWVHGGGFMDGAGSYMGPDYFMDEDVILVTINYRLGALGFLSTEDGIIPGNLGLKDMVLALKWVQRNIPGFHGNPDEVTIFGESAGGNAVHTLMLSPAAKGLFRAVISQSGTALSPWSVTLTPEKFAKTLGTTVSCSLESSAELAKCLKTKSVEAILTAQTAITHANPDALAIAFGPSIEANLPRFRSQKSDYILLPASPYELIANDFHKNSRDVPFIVGGNDMEGLLIFAIGYVYNEDKMKSLNDNWVEQTSSTMTYGSYVPPERLEGFARELRSIYYGAEGLKIENSDLLIRLHSDFNFYRGFTLAADLHSQTNQHVYPYILKYQGEFSISNLAGVPTRGVTHADDLQYLWPSLKVPQNWPNLKPNSSDEAFSKNLVKLWASFAIHGKPSMTWGDEWKPVANEQYGSQLKKISWLHLDTEPKLVEETDEGWERINKLDSLFSKFERPQVSWRAGSGMGESTKPPKTEL